jgi:arginine/lysine/ornithine decarboxylase
LDQSRAPLYEAVQKYIKRDMVPFHMPGHSHGRGVPSFIKKVFHEDFLKFDLTEVSGLDYLHYAKGVIREAEDLAADLYGVKRTFFLINGTTAGVHTMILATCKEGEKIIVGRNSHRSVIGGIIASGANPVFVHPEFNEEFGIITNLTPEALEKTIQENRDAKAVLITTPNYYGFQGNLKEMIDTVHKYGMFALVDEAHGAHFPFNDKFPKSAIEYGADMVVQSAHKTLPTLTQTSLLHIVSERINADMVEQSLAIIESSSPSYIFMTFLDVVRREMALHGQKLWDEAISIADYAREQISKLPHLKVVDERIVNGNDIYAFDPIKLTINVKELGVSGFEFESFLNKNQVEIELSDLQNVLLFITIGNRREDIDYLVKVLKKAEKNERGIIENVPEFPVAGKQIFSPNDAFNMDYKIDDIMNTKGKISWGIVAPYPPGIPILAPGMEITDDAINFILTMYRRGGMIQGAIEDNGKIYVRIVREA